jgi:hypothetical protein
VLVVLFKTILIHELMDPLPGRQTEMVIAVGADLQVGFQFGNINLFVAFFSSDPEIFILGGFFSADTGLKFIYP